MRSRSQLPSFGQPVWETFSRARRSVHALVDDAARDRIGCPLAPLAVLDAIEGRRWHARTWLRPDRA